MPRAVFPTGRKLLLLTVLAAGILGGAWWWTGPPREPLHDNQYLSGWVAELKDNQYDAFHREMLHAFGPDAIPWLTYTAEYGRHPFKKHGPLPLDKAPDWLRRLLPERWGGLRASSARDDRIDALRALHLLGHEAAPAIPTLVRILEHVSRDNDESEVARAVTAALQSTGPASWPPVQQILEHGSPRAREITLSAMDGRLDPFAGPVPDAEVARVIATLTTACDDPSAAVRQGAAEGLSQCCSAWPQLPGLDIALPKAFQLLSDTDQDVKLEVVEMLYSLGPKGASAVPRLMEMLDDPAAAIRGNAADALGFVDQREKRSAARLRAMFHDDQNADCRQQAGYALDRLGLPREAEPTRPEALPAP